MLRPTPLVRFPIRATNQGVTMLDVVPSGQPRCGLSSTTMGRASEMEAAAILMRAGHRVAVPLADDDGVDLVVNYTHTAQVKASGNLSEPSKGDKSWIGNYVFSLKGRLTADFLICHAVPDDAWWIIPSHVLGDPAHVTSLALALAPRKRGTRAEVLNVYRDAWHVFDR